MRLCIFISKGGHVFTLSPFTGEKFAMMGSTSNNTNVKEDDQALTQLGTEARVLKLDEVGQVKQEIPSRRSWRT